MGAKLNLDAAVVHDLYWNQNNDIKTIAQQCQCHATSVWNFMKKNNISRRTPGEAHLGYRHNEISKRNFSIGQQKRWAIVFQSQYKPWRDEKRLQKEYLENKKSTPQLSEEWNTDSKTIFRWLDKFNISKRTRQEAAQLMPIRCGERSSGWKGGKHDFLGYVRIYQGRTDGKTQYKFEHIIKAEKALGRPLKKNEIVHHVNGNKADNRNENLLICDKSYHAWLHWKMSELYMKEHFGGNHGA